MPERSRRRRAGRARLIGRRRSSTLADRLGTALKNGRLAAGLTQQELADEVGVTQGWVSEAERGLGASGSIETWASLAAGVGLQLAAFLELAPGATPPRDMEHLRRQQAAMELAGPGGWTARPEVTISTADGVQRFIDVLLERRHEIVVIEIVNLIADFGGDLRGLERKIAAVSQQRPGLPVRGLLIVRATHRNRVVIRELSAMIHARFPASPAAWLRALASGAPMPDADGFLWSESRSAGLRAPRLARGARPAPRQSRRPPRPERAGSGT